MLLLEPPPNEVISISFRSLQIEAAITFSLATDFSSCQRMCTTSAAGVTVCMQLVQQPT